MLRTLYTCLLRSHFKMKQVDKVRVRKSTSTCLRWMHTQTRLQCKDSGRKLEARVKICTLSLASPKTYLVTTSVCPFTSMLASGFSRSFPGRSLKMRISGSCMNWPMKPSPDTHLCVTQGRQRQGWPCALVPWPDFLG